MLKLLVPKICFLSRETIESGLKALLSLLSNLLSPNTPAIPLPRQ